MAARVDELTSCFRVVAFNHQHERAAWAALEQKLVEWRDPSEGGQVNSDFLDDNLGYVLSSGLLHSVFHLSKLTPTPTSSRSIKLANELWVRLYGAVERAAIVARIRGLPSPPSPRCESPTFGRRSFSKSPKCS